MQTNDIIMLSVVGTNGSTRQQRTIAARFNGAGFELDDQGKQTGYTAVLTGLPSGGGAKPPEFPASEYAAAAALGSAGADKIRAIMSNHDRRVREWEQTTGGGSERAQIANAALRYLEQKHNFSIEKDDPSKFVVKRENLDVSQKELPDGRTVWTVAGTAVFG